MKIPALFATAGLLAASVAVAQTAAPRQGERSERAAERFAASDGNRDGRLSLDFEDPEGQRLTLIDDGGVGESFPWEKSPVPAPQQVRPNVSS